MKIVELQTPDQGADLEELIELQHAEIGGGRRLDLDMCRNSMFYVVADHKRERLNCWLVYSDDGQCIGYLGAFVNQPFYSRAVHAHADEFYVRPEARNSRAFFMLLNAFEKWAMSKADLEMIQLNVQHGEINTATARIMQAVQRFGYRQGGVFAVKMAADMKQTQAA